MGAVEAMNLLTRYLAREIYFSVALVFFALLMLFSLFDLINQLNEMGTGNYSLMYMLIFVALTIPSHVYELFPVAVLIGTIVALVQMSANSELTVYRASGVSLKSLVLALLRIGIPMMILCVVVGEFVSPPSEKLALKIKLKAQNLNLNVSEFRSGVWAKDEGSFVNVRNVMSDTSLQEITIYQFDERYQLQGIIAANRASYRAEKEWLLKDVKQTKFSEQGATIHNQAELVWHTALNPGILTVLLVVPEKMTAMSLYQYTQHLSDNNQQTARYEIAMWGKLAYPIAVLVMMVLALAFSSYNKREGGVGTKIFVGVVLGLTFHFAGRLFANLGALNEWNSLLSATAMNWLFLALALTLLWRAERR